MHTITINLILTTTKVLIQSTIVLSVKERANKTKI